MEGFECIQLLGIRSVDGLEGALGDARRRSINGEPELWAHLLGGVRGFQVEDDHCGGHESGFARAHALPVGITVFGNLEWELPAHLVIHQCDELQRVGSMVRHEGSRGE